MSQEKWVTYNSTEQIEEKDYEQFKIYCIRARQLRENWADFVRDRKTLSMNFVRTSGQVDENGSSENPHRLKGLYLDFRVFIAQQEETEFKRICNKISQKFSNDHARAFIKYEKDVWDRDNALKSWHGYDSRALVHTYFNASLFHSDRQKRSILIDILEKVSEPALASIILLEIDSKRRQINNILLAFEFLERHQPRLKVPIANFTNP
ncbi:hypothetical protein [Antarctobacter heliothermus]|uniref:Uncharacterized protein n=1 Tax=Antarctobacter heliothermus TaxID=74033 RepID=A0A239BF52_9RHOB|nr:hypothetical protein [Antarctobacter heliothermus]SNS06446.1 hypothetical protein SAMN04488078_100375 [Antarctobacter heliothermus]